MTFFTKKKLAKTHVPNLMHLQNEIGNLFLPKEEKCRN